MLKEPVRTKVLSQIFQLKEIQQYFANCDIKVYENLPDKNCSIIKLFCPNAKFRVSEKNYEEFYIKLEVDLLNSINAILHKNKQTFVCYNIEMLFVLAGIPEPADTIPIEKFKNMPFPDYKLDKLKK